VAAARGTIHRKVMLVLHRSPLTLADLWVTAHFTPNPTQRDAITHIHGPLYLRAGRRHQGRGLNAEA
jgi:hypothetical protein